MGRVRQLSRCSKTAVWAWNEFKGQGYLSGTAVGRCWGHPASARTHPSWEHTPLLTPVVVPTAVGTCWAQSPLRDRTMREAAGGEDRSIVCWSVIWWTGMPTRPKGVSLSPQNATSDLYKSVGVPEGALVCVSNRSTVISLSLKGLCCCLFYYTNWKRCSVWGLRELYGIKWHGKSLSAC